MLQQPNDTQYSMLPVSKLETHLPLLTFCPTATPAGIVNAACTIAVVFVALLVTLEAAIIITPPLVAPVWS
jgi:hypothetical protein